MARVLPITPVAVPSLDELAADPERVTALPAAVAEALQTKCLLVLNALWGRCLAARAAAVQTPALAGLVGAGEMADLLGTPENWVRDKARAGHIPFVRLGHYVKFNPTEVLDAVRRLPVQHNRTLRVTEKRTEKRGGRRPVSTECPNSSGTEGANSA